MATKVKGDTIVEIIEEFGVSEKLIPGVIIEVDDLEEADLIQTRNTGITKYRRKIYLGEWAEID